MFSIAARSLERRSAAPVARLIHTRSSLLVSEKDGSGAGGAAKVVVIPAATATIVTPNTQPDTHYTSSIPPTQPQPTPTLTPAPTPSTTTTTTTTPTSTTTPPPPLPQPTQHRPVVVAAPPPPPPASEGPSSYGGRGRPRSSLRGRVSAFLIGVGVAAGAGYYRLQSDVWSSARALEGQIEGLRASGGAGAGGESRALANKVAALEKRVAELEKEKGKK